MRELYYLKDECMANVMLGVGLNMYNLTALDDKTGKLIAQGPSGFTWYSTQTGIKGEILGNGLTYDDSGFSGGTATEITITQYGSIVLKVSNASISGAADYYNMGYDGEIGASAELAYWLRDGDVISASSGNETIRGYEGDDLFIADAGNDTIDGGRNSDTVEYAGDRQNFTVSQNGAGLTVASSQFGTDTLLNIEFLKFNGQTVSITDALNNNTSPSNSTADFLIQKFNIPIDAARQWVMDHLDTPKDIYDICSAGGITSNMLADVVQGSFPTITITGVVVNDWLHLQGLPSLA